VQSQTDIFERDVLTAIPMLRRVAMRYCRNDTKAEDLVQDTLLRALIYRERYERGTKLDAWLITILKNHFLSGFRKGRRSVEDPDEAMAKAIPFEDSALKKLEVAEMLRLIDKMPDAFRVPLRMVADGATYEEVAIELCEQIGTIKSRVARGRELLRAAG
jgi:RNA polymerase sigma-70 factor (ECF subfamily)